MKENQGLDIEVYSTEFETYDEFVQVVSKHSEPSAKLLRNLSEDSKLCSECVVWVPTNGEKEVEIVWFVKMNGSS